VFFASHGEQDPLDGDGKVVGLLRDLSAWSVRMASPSIPGACSPIPVTKALCDQLVDLTLGGLGIAPGGLNEARGHALFVIEQRFQQMRRSDALMMFTNRIVWAAWRNPRARSVSFQNHQACPSFLGRYGVALATQGRRSRFGPLIRRILRSLAGQAAWQLRLPILGMRSPQPLHKRWSRRR
jgi:hypothetical protein